LNRCFFAALAAAGLLIVSAGAFPLAAQLPYKSQAPKIQLGPTAIDLAGPAGFQRVDGLDHDIDEALSAFQPDLTLAEAIFAEPGAWKSFFDEIYGPRPSDLAYYATVAASQAQDIASLDFERLDRFFANIPVAGGAGPAGGGDDAPPAGATASTAFELIDRGADHISFKTRLGAFSRGPDGAENFSPRYFAVTSAILAEGRILFLNLYAANKGPAPEQAEALALAWRDRYLKMLESGKAPN
jgi:hypothetical protein